LGLPRLAIVSLAHQNQAVSKTVEKHPQFSQEKLLLCSILFANQRKGEEMMQDQLEFPACPKNKRNFINTSSLESLVYWKLAAFVEALPEDVGAAELHLREKVIAHVEHPVFALVLRKTKGNFSTAAKVLGINRNTIHRKLRKKSIIPRQLRHFLNLN
jgi:DNA-binding protein Fis